MNDTTPLIQVKGIGEKTYELYQKLDLFTAGDLLRHYPRNYEVFDPPVCIAKAAAGEVCAVRACVTGIQNLKKVRSLTILNVSVKDVSGEMLLTFFNMPFLKNQLKKGGFYIFRGQTVMRANRKVMEQAKIYSEADYSALQGSVHPKYPLTKGLSNSSMEKALHIILDTYEWEPEYLPDITLSRYHLLSVKEALYNIHFPQDFDALKQARKRLVFEEFLDFALYLRYQKKAATVTPNAYRMKPSALTDDFISALPFPLTGAQTRVWQEICADMAGDYAMNRLIQGDVGSGKTILAILALLLCCCNGYQGAFMAPTEVLASQHYQTVCEYTAKYGLPFHPVLLSGSLTAKERKEAYRQIESGEANLIIGTHAVIQEKVIFHNLALTITDEQHRFGVRQREKLASKGNMPHILVMSATPIPRTLAIILYGDLHLSVVDELPANRLPIKNCVVNTSFRTKAYSFIEKQIAEGRQAYVICPMVEEGETEELENVTEYRRKLKEALPESIRIQALHGKMPPAQKERIMAQFAAHEIDVLVSTTVIEVGINVPNATVMLVENAERFGLAQLHQLRGRVGRGAAQSYCIFISTKENTKTMERLSILNHSNDGFFIASEDLKLRGPGDFFGIRQSGDFAFRLGDIYADADSLKQAAEEADRIFKEDPELKNSENQPLKVHLENCRKISIDFRSI